MAVCPTLEQLDFSSVYTECCRLGCKKQVKRGEVCSCDAIVGISQAISKQFTRRDCEAITFF
ncbi:hypothetical protein N7489_008391 [Penicillium chrysogenum]|uniref:Extracellular membrane protein CFEM domain-containing protein n=1 Tax=Penicillium chrysogenum TaxID=5076 RepID=A0ABQ8X0H8_PENCH|nr:uncharacterized protein N7489_008391 [Penicillium chrysogenum]KAJ5227683.1 hypothetical protein N7489_008391 [Penicillium chrysogenum]KAJ5284681.1 hypothetical protein N7505_002661 [Penicillium chrysogenum]KAJ6167183.1 hypothetical protein N7497_000026 [Penicillium chrysogenum]